MYTVNILSRVNKRNIYWLLDGVRVHIYTGPYVASVEFCNSLNVMLSNLSRRSKSSWPTVNHPTYDWNALLNSTTLAQRTWNIDISPSEGRQTQLWHLAGVNEHMLRQLFVCGLSVGFCNSLSIKCLFPPLWHVNKKRILYSNHVENCGSSTIETSHARQGRQIFQRNAIADKRSACEGMYFLGLYCKIKNAKCDKWKQCQIHCRRRYSFLTVML